MHGMQWNTIQSKWQKAWADAGLGKAKKSDKPKFFMLFAYPGISGFLHVGHMRGFSYTDAICRLERMKGKEVFFPVGTHASGNHAFAFANKIKNNDQTWINYLSDNGCDDPHKLKTPDKIIDYFNSVYVEDYWKKFGFLADYQRFTSTNQPGYEKFIQWQFTKLMEKDMLVQKPYYATYSELSGPVAVDPSETDISQGGNAEKIEYTVVYFKCDDLYLPCATLRPETLYGVTNLWVRQDQDYEIVEFKGKRMVLSSEAAKKVEFQYDSVKHVGKMTGEELVLRTVTHPITKQSIECVHAPFVDLDKGTGIVMSVPSDAPFDYAAMQKAGKTYELKHIITTKKYGQFPAKELYKKSYSDDKLQELTTEVYKHSHHTGTLTDSCGPYEGMTVAEAKEVMKADLLEQDNAFILRDLSELVLDRLGDKVYIKRIDDQWFIDYGNETVTRLAKEHAEKMRIMPEEYKDHIHGILDWFGERACARQGNWIGSKLPFDKDWIVEPISDSTLYPAYYIVSKFVNNGTVTINELTTEFFDYVFLGKGKLEQYKEIREEFEYFYPVDINLGGKEHKTVHFPVYLMNHIAIMPEKCWPKGIFVNWWVTGKGGKISKSKGGAEPIPNAIEKYSVDAMRLYYAHIGSPHTDVVWDESVVQGYKSQTEKIWYMFEHVNTLKGEHAMIDDWLLANFNQTLHKINLSLEQYDLRTLATGAYYQIPDMLRWYDRRGGCNKQLLNSILQHWVTLLTPITPHLAEELNEKYKLHKGLVSEAAWPIAERSIEHAKQLYSEDMVKSVLTSLRDVQKLAKLDNLTSVTLTVAEPWQYTAYHHIKSMVGQTRNVGEIIKHCLAQDELKMHSSKVSKLVTSLLKNPQRIPVEVTDQDYEHDVLLNAKSFIEKEFGCTVVVERNQESSSLKKGVPGKPGILAK